MQLTRGERVEIVHVGHVRTLPAAGGGWGGGGWGRWWLRPRCLLAALDRGVEQAEGRRPEIEHGGVELQQGEIAAPRLPGRLAQVHDLQLAPGVAPVGRIEGGPGRLGERSLTEQVRI